MIAPCCAACGAPMDAVWCRRVLVDCSRRLDTPPGVLLPSGVALTPRPLVLESDLRRHAFRAPCPSCGGACPVRITDARDHVPDVAAWNATQAAVRGTPAVSV